MLTRALLVLVLVLSSASSAAAFSTEPYARVLDRFVDGSGLVDYAGLTADGGDLDTFVRSIASLDSSTWDGYTDDDRLAWWLNAYNALTLRLIVNHYPIQPITDEFPASSIRQIYGAWTRLEWNVMGRIMTLDRMEHEIIRVEFDEPRVHMALVCAALSCPPLRREPYTGERLDDQLQDQSRIFVTDPRNVTIDRENRTLRLSAIFKWFGGDFPNLYDTGTPPFDDARERAVVSFVSGFLPEADQKWLATGDYQIVYFEYDWSLNDRAR